MLNIGHDKPVLIVGEIGGNHNGDIENALKLIDVAKAAGCDAVKFQKRAVYESVPKHMWDIVKDTPEGPMPYIMYRQSLELGLEEYQRIDAHCKDVGIEWFASVWDIPSMILIKENFDVIAYKIPSACLTDEDLLLNLSRQSSRHGMPIILSTGMSTMEQVRYAVALLQNNGANLVICQCNSTYPCPNKDLNLRVMDTFRLEFPGTPIGYSGHETGLTPTIAAVAMGACYIERHITLDRTMWGTDQSASVEPGGLQRLVHNIRVVEQALGDGIKQVTASEKDAMYKLRRYNDFARNSSQV